MMVSILKDAGFPTDEFFPHIQLDDESADNGVAPVEETEDNPLDNI